MAPYVTVHDLASTAMIHGPGDLYNPPALTNFRGACQAARDAMAIQHLTFPPFSQGDVAIGLLSIDDIATIELPVTYRWRPDLITREAQTRGWWITTRTCMGVGANTVHIELTIKSATARSARIRIRTGDGIISSKDGWTTPYSPKEKGSISVTPWEGAPARTESNRRELLTDGLLYASTTSDARSVQALSPRPDSIDTQFFHVSADFKAGESKTWHFLVAVGRDPMKDHADWQKSPGRAFAAAEADWSRELEAAFTPGNDRYSGCLPRLETSNAGLRALYLAGAMSAIYLKREASQRTYTTLMPRYWATTSFINDWSLVSSTLSLLDPDCVRRHVELWLERDIRKHFGSEYVTGRDAGNWYSCNDYAMTRLISAYFRVTGDVAWLKKHGDQLKRIALHHGELGRGLADYGDRNSLLECVGTYTHQVASLNAAAVWTYREVADLLEQAGDAATAADFRKGAAALIPEVQKLYVPGGTWTCRHSDGSLVPVRHAWDFVHVMNHLHADLPKAQIDEMVAYFQKELQTPGWMHALSPLDGDADFSLRPDHQWNGSYPAWVALALGALRKAGRHDLMAQWLPGLARAANQGPFSQAHFVESYAAPENGGARKAPTEWPYINDWAILSGAAFVDTIIHDIFGVDFGLDRVTASPSLAGIDENARLEGLRVQGKLYTVSAKGVEST